MALRKKEFGLSLMDGFRAGMVFFGKDSHVSIAAMLPSCLSTPMRSMGDAIDQALGRPIGAV
jgi:hypothetical protein